MYKMVLSTLSDIMLCIYFSQQGSSFRPPIPEEAKEETIEMSSLERLVQYHN